VVLEELDAFMRSRQEAFLSAMGDAKTADAAYMVTCQYRALLSFVGEAKADVAIGDHAAKELLERG
jgi:hypothetical protein